VNLLGLRRHGIAQNSTLGDRSRTSSYAMGYVVIAVCYVVVAVYSLRARRDVKSREVSAALQEI